MKRKRESDSDNATRFFEALSKTRGNNFNEEKLEGSKDVDEVSVDIRGLYNNESFSDVQLRFFLKMQRT